MLNLVFLREAVDLETEDEEEDSGFEEDFLDSWR